MDSLPSPVSSPSLTPKEGPSIGLSRKRQRSQSMNSESSSSSLKRAGASLEARSPRTDDMSTLSLFDPSDDIDSYMAEQGDGDNSNIISQPTCPPEQKLLTIDELNKRPMEINDTWYLVSREWYKRWRKACTGEVDKEGRVDERDLGPVDNSSLVDQKGNLTSSAVEGVNVQFVHSDAWHSFVKWCLLP
jgi:ubiquitin carboxyl-terminal hydrolase 4/11/15